MLSFTFNVTGFGPGFKTPIEGSDIWNGCMELTDESGILYDKPFRVAYRREVPKTERPPSFQLGVTLALGIRRCERIFDAVWNTFEEQIEADMAAMPEVRNYLDAMKEQQRWITAIQ